MTFKDVVSIAAAVIASLGGGGIIVYKLSGYLGKLWADRALEEQKHKYSEMNIQLQNQLELAVRRLQVELDSVGLIHKLRTEGEFQRLASLWKRLATLRNSFTALCGNGMRLSPSDATIRKEAEEKQRVAFEADLNAAGMFLIEETLFIPKPIVDLAEEALKQAHMEIFNYVGFQGYLGEHGDRDMQIQYRKASSEFLQAFQMRMQVIEISMRNHISGTFEAGEHKTQ